MDTNNSSEGVELLIGCVINLSLEKEENIYANRTLIWQIWLTFISQAGKVPCKDILICRDILVHRQTN